MEFGKEYFKGYKEQGFRWDFWEKYIRKTMPSEAKILEVGCGYGYLQKRLKKWPNLVGIDVSEHAIEEARKNSNSKFEVMDATKLEFENDYFDMIITLDTLEHLEDPEKAIKEFYRVLKKNGKIILTTPNPESKSKELKKEEWFALKDKTHVSIKTMKEWKELFEKNGFVIEKEKTLDVFDRGKLWSIVNLVKYKTNNPFTKKGDNIYLEVRKNVI